MFRTLNAWLHNSAHAIAKRLHPRESQELAFNGIHDFCSSGEHQILGENPNRPVDLSGWHFVLVGDLKQAKSAYNSLDRSSLTYRELMPMGKRGFIVRWK